MQKNLKRASAMILSLAMAVQFGLTDSYYIKANDEQPVEETKQENEASKSNVKDKDASNEDSANTPIAEEKTTDEKSDAEEAMTNSDETATSFSMMLAENANDTYKVELRSQNNSPLETVSLNVGKITDNFEGGKITLEGKTYSFVEARVIKKSNPTDYTPISYVAVYNGVTYYSTNSITGSPLEVEAGESIVVILKEDVTQYTVNYKLIVDGVEKTANISDYITLEGNETSVDTGTSFSFLVKPNKGFTVASVKQDNTELTAEGTKYSTNSITANTTVTIALNEKKKASIRLNGSNTTFVYNGETRDSTSNGKGWAIDQQFETNTNSLSFDLIGRLQYIQEHDRELNKVAVSLHDGSTYSLSKKSINIPTAPGQSVETQLTDDLKAIVTKGNEKISIGNGAYSYRYSVTFSSKNNIYDDIDISTNFKDATASELFVTSTVGVSTITCEKPNGIQILDPAKSDSNFLGLTPDEKYTFKFSVLSGYIPDASKISVEGTVDGKTLDKVTVTKQTNGSFSFEITADQDKYDYRIQVVATKSQYKLAYLDDETVIDSSSKLNAGEQATITSKKPRKDGYVFNGWTIEGDPSGTIYSSKEVVNIDDLIAYSSWDATDGVSKITFEPKWLKADEAKSVGYTILVHFDDDTPDREYDARTAPNKSVKVFKNELEASLGIDPDKYYLDSDQAFDMNNVKDGDVIEVTYHVRKELEVGNLSNVPYKGSTQKLVPTVSAEDNSSLVEGTDYTVSYSDGDYTNVTEKDLTVTITGIGKYKGTYTVSYQIIPKEYTVTTESDSKVYDGNALTAGGHVNGLVEGETVSFKTTGSQTNEGTSDNTYELKFEGTAVETNYKHGKDSIGTLTVKNQSIDPGTEEKPNPDYKGVKVNSPSDSEYDGKEHKWIPTVTDKADKKLEAGKDYTVEYSTKNSTKNFKDVGTIEVTITGKGNYTGTVKRSYKVTPKEYTVTTESDSKVYDGNALTAGGHVNGLVEGETVSFKTTGSQTNEGTSDNTYELKFEGTAVETNYKHGKDSIGTLTVKNQSIDPGTEEKPNPDYKGVKVNSPSDSEYDGKEHKWIPTVTDKADKKLEAGKDYTVEYSTKNSTKNFKDVGTIEVTITGKGNYTGTVKRSYKVTPKEYTVTTESDSKVYDGNALTAGGHVNGLVEGETVSFKTTGSQTNEGTSDNTYELKFEGTAVETNYKHGKDSIGTLTVKNQSIDPGTEEKPNPDYKGVKVNSPSDSEYDGKEHKWIPTVTDKADKKLEAGKDYTVEYSTKNSTKNFKDVGTIEVTITGKGNYTGTVKRSYKVTPKEYTVTTESDSKVYDGNALTAGGHVNGLVEGETVSFKTTGSQTNEGTSDNTYELKFEGTAVETNYKHGKDSIGTLTVKNQSIDPGTEEKPNPDYKGVKVNSPSDSEYDGKEHKWIPTVTDKADKKLEAGKDYTVEYSTKNSTKNFKDVGTIEVTITGKGNYTGTVKRSYKVTPKEYTVTTESDSKVYDGNALTAGGHVNGLVEGETVSFKTTGSQTNEGTSDNTYELKFEGTAVETNYKHGKDSIGTLTVKNQSIDPGTEEKPNPDYKGVKVNSPSDSEYDGKEHKWIPTVTDKADKKLEAGKDYTVEYSTKNSTKNFKDVGTIEVTITGKGNYTGTVKRSYKVTPKEYTVTTESDSKVYDGNALTAGGKIEGIVKDETYSFTITGTQTDVGSSKNTYELVWKSAKATNYTLAKESIGTLTVKAKSIIPDGPKTPEDKKTGITVENPGDVKYDGKDHAEKPVIKDEKTGVTLEEGKDYEIVYPDDIKNAGEITATVVGKGDYEGSFEIKYNITKRDVTFTSATDSKQYDGNALTNGNVEITGDGFAEDEGAEYKVTGTQTQVGNSANEFEYTLNENTLASNYDITKVVGTLTVTAAPAPETPEKPSKQEKPAKPGKVKTGLQTNTGILMVAGTLALVGLGVCVALERRKKY